LAQAAWLAGAAIPPSTTTTARFLVTGRCPGQASLLPTALHRSSRNQGGESPPPDSQPKQAPGSSRRDRTLSASAGTLLDGFDTCWYQIFLNNKALLQS